MSNKYLRHALEQAEDDVTQLREENERLKKRIENLHQSLKKGADRWDRLAKLMTEELKTRDE